MKLFFVQLFCLFLFFNSTCASSQDNNRDTLNKLGGTQFSDTSRLSVQQKSPLNAILYSLLVPGLGQVYVQQYWKAPLFFAGAIVMYYYSIKHHKDFLNYSRQYDEISIINPQDPSLLFLKVRRENSRDNRDISIFFLVGVYGLSMLDAYVGAHLFSFDVSEKISLAFHPNSSGFRFSISIFR